MRRLVRAGCGDAPSERSYLGACDGLLTPARSGRRSTSRISSAMSCWTCAAAALPARSSCSARCCARPVILPRASTSWSSRTCAGLTRRPWINSTSSAAGIRTPPMLLISTYHDDDAEGGGLLGLKLFWPRACAEQNEAPRRSMCSRRSLPTPSASSPREAARAAPLPADRAATVLCLKRNMAGIEVVSSLGARCRARPGRRA